MPSHWNRNRKHAGRSERCLTAAFRSLQETGFTIKPAIRSLVLVSKCTNNPAQSKAKVGLEDILKVDPVRQSHAEILKTTTTAEALAGDFFRYAGSLAKQLAALHKPSEFNRHAKFGLDKIALTWLLRGSAPLSTLEMATPVAGRPQAGTDRPGLHCTSCAVAVSQKGRFCLENSIRFAGRVLCMDCQKDPPTGAAIATASADCGGGHHWYALAVTLASRPWQIL